MDIRKELRGVCYVKCDSKTAMRLMNICSHRNICTWCKKSGEDGFCIYSDNSAEIAGVAEKYNMEIDIIEIKSLKSFFYRNKKRISVIAGLLIFMLLIYIQSLYIWHIEVDGNGKYTDEKNNKNTSVQYF